MIPYRNCEIIASVIFFFTIKIFCYITETYRAMYKRQTTLTSIPENNENEEEFMTKKWVPKKKHEILKAKYKCLKKLFQIYDASVIGILPQECTEVEPEANRKKRSRRTKTDAFEGSVELASGDVTRTNSQVNSVATAVMRDLKMTQCSSTIINNKLQVTKFDKYANTRSIENLTIDKECEVRQHPIPYLITNEKRKPTRFQIFMQRLFGIRRGTFYRDILSNGHIYAASDNNITQSFWERRRRRNSRFRRLRKPIKIQSDSALKNLKSPVILTYVQSVQRSCLLDRTLRQCHIMGCGMLFYGIINYNDHLNLCHFTDRKYICHYCHEGFESDYDKFVHEYNHMGINKLDKNITIISPSRESTKRASNTQTDPEFSKYEDERLKKIVSFFDKIGDPDKIVTEIKNIRHCEFHLQPSSKPNVTQTGGDSTDSEKRAVSCVNFHRRIDEGKFTSSANSEVTSKDPFDSAVVCRVCGESFDYRRQLSLHVDLEHRVHDKFSKFHSCAGIVNYRQPKRIDMVSEDGKIQVQSIDRSHSGIARVNTTSSFSETLKSEASLSRDQSMNIVYYTSSESLRKPSLVNNVLQKVKSGIHYKWEPGTKIIRV